MTGRSPYSRAAITLHWLVALLIIGNLIGGFLMGGMLNSPDPEQRRLGFTIVQLHKSIGLTVLMLAVLRLILRLAEGFPPLPAHMTAIERLLARVTHWGFYALMILIPLSGWVMASTSPFNFPTQYFGLFEWPHLPMETSRESSEGAGKAHETMAWMAIVLLALHVAGALKHHIFDRDDVLSRMIPMLRR